MVHRSNVNFAELKNREQGSLVMLCCKLNYTKSRHPKPLHPVREINVGCVGDNEDRAGSKEDLGEHDVLNCCSRIASGLH